MIVITKDAAYTTSILDVHRHSVWRDNHGRVRFGAYDPALGATGSENGDKIDFIHPSDVLYFDGLPITNLGSGVFEIGGGPLPWTTTTTIPWTSTTALPPTTTTVLPGTTTSYPTTTTYGGPCDPICVKLSGYAHDLCGEDPDRYCDEVNALYQLCWGMPVDRSWRRQYCDPGSPGPAGIAASLGWRVDLGKWRSWTRIDQIGADCVVVWTSTVDPPENPLYPTIDDCPPTDPADWVEDLSEECTGGAFQVCLQACSECVF